MLKLAEYPERTMAVCVRYVAFLSSLMFAFVVSTVNGKPVHGDAGKYQEHMKILDRFPCAVPQPRVIPVTELLRGKYETYEDVSPHNTVLHRCDAETGCCKKHEVCRVNSSEEVDLHFLVMNVVTYEASQFKCFRVTNHTSCSCKPVRSVIK